MNSKRNIFKSLLNFFFKGILLTVPLALTVYIIYYVFVTLDTLLDRLIKFNTPGLGILVLLVIITIMGVIGSTFISDPLIRYFNKGLEKAPLIKTIYTSIKDLLSAFVGDKKGFSKPVMVKMGVEGVERVGFITNEDLSDLQIGDEKIAVYFPFSYAFTGNLFIIDKKLITPLDANSADVMKFIVSGGVAEVPKPKKETE